jgi:hypothetical protein
MRMEVGNQSLEKLPNFILGPPLIRSAHQRIDSLDRALSEKAVASTENLGVIRGQNILGREEHFLVQLLAGANAGEFDLDIGANLES